jgi:hypothetical protein
MSCGVGAQQICRCGITHVPCNLKVGLSNTGQALLRFCQKVAFRRTKEPTCFIDVRILRNRNIAMCAAMTFSKYTREPDLMEAMRAAFYRVCDVLQLSCDREDPLTEVVVTKIVELAKAGERDPEILCFSVLAELEMPL